MEWLELNIDTSHAGLDAVTDMLEQQGVTGRANAVHVGGGVVHLAQRRVGAASLDHAQHRQQQRDQHADAAGDGRGPEEAAAVLPVFAPQQPLELGGMEPGGVVRNRGFGRGNRRRVHA